MPKLFTDTYSRFYDTDSVSFDDQTTFGYWSKPDLLSRKLKDDEVIRYVVNSNVAGRPDLISQEIYSTTKLDWLIISYNKVNGVFNWPKSGDVIEIPKPSLVSSEII